MRIRQCPICPSCGSEETGEILLQTFSNVKTQARFFNRELKKGRIVKFVSPSKWSYYKDFGINCFCNHCNYEFVGNIEEIDMKKEDANKIYETSGLKYQFSLIKKEPMFSKIKKKLISTKNSDKERIKNG